MNANEISPKANSRMNRIKKVSRTVRLLFQYGIPLMIVASQVRFAFWHQKLMSAINSGQPIADLNPLGKGVPLGKSVFDMPLSIQFAFVAWMILFLVVWLLWYQTILGLFRLFEKGVLFTSETVRSIKMLGMVYLAKLIVQIGLSLFPAFGEKPKDGVNLTADLFTCFFIIFIGWLIDEARKLREEQELTV
jgi:hypothetical protein